VADIQSRDLVAALDEASLSRFHLRAVLVSGMRFFTDAYDLFALTLVLPEPAGRSLEDITVSTPGTTAPSLRVADQPSAP
jgi:MFS transporter, PHS family, inorganic phosphate transporter